MVCETFSIWREERTLARKVRLPRHTLCQSLRAQAYPVLSVHRPSFMNLRFQFTLVHQTMGRFVQSPPSIKTANASSYVAHTVACIAGDNWYLAFSCR